VIILIAANQVFQNKTCPFQSKVLGFPFVNDLVLIAVLSVAIAGYQFEMESFLSKFANFTSEISFDAIHLLPPEGFLLYVQRLGCLLHLSIVVAFDTKTYLQGTTCKTTHLGRAARSNF
jgi:hypothetical protein